MRNSEGMENGGEEFRPTAELCIPVGTKTKSYNEADWEKSPAFVSHFLEKSCPRHLMKPQTPALARDADPFAPGEDFEVRTSRNLQYRDKLQQVVIWITEVNTCRGHPSQHHWFFGGCSGKVQRGDPRVP